MEINQKLKSLCEDPRLLIEISCKKDIKITLSHGTIAYIQNLSYLIIKI